MNHECFFGKLCQQTLQILTAQVLIGSKAAKKVPPPTPVSRPSNFFVVLRRFCRCVYVLAQPLLPRWIRRLEAKLQSRFHHPQWSAVPAICLCGSEKVLSLCVCVGSTATALQVGSETEGKAAEQVPPPTPVSRPSNLFVVLRRFCHCVYVLDQLLLPRWIRRWEAKPSKFHHPQW